MRKITQASTTAFLAFQNFQRDNTSVKVTSFQPLQAELSLHRNVIAKNEAGVISIRSTGWETPTTKDRLNGILKTAALGYVYAENYVWWYQPSDETAPRVRVPSYEWLRAT